MIEVPEPERSADPATSWPSTAAEFVSARAALFRLEAGHAGRVATFRAVLLALIGMCCLTAWLTGMAGLIGLVAAAGDFAWHYAAIGCAVLHLILAGIVVAVLRRPAKPSFPLFKSELQKDQEWLRQLKEKLKR